MHMFRTILWFENDNPDGHVFGIYGSSQWKRKMNKLLLKAGNYKMGNLLMKWGCYTSNTIRDILKPGYCFIYPPTLTAQHAVIAFTINLIPWCQNIHSYLQIISRNLFVLSATAPLWVYTVGTYVFNQEIYMLRFCGLMALISLVQILGFLLRYARPPIANAVLTWFSRPFLLLAGILFVTLGVYINQYVFQAPQPIAYLQHVGVALLIMLTMSYACGWLAGLLLNISVRRTRALANQVSVYQGLLAIPLLRICVPSPEGEQVSAAALWTVFLAPVPLIYNAVLKVG